MLPKMVSNIGTFEEKSIATLVVTIKSLFKSSALGVVGLLYIVLAIRHAEEMLLRGNSMNIFWSIPLKILNVEIAATHLWLVAWLTFLVYPLLVLSSSVHPFQGRRPLLHMLMQVL